MCSSLFVGGGCGCVFGLGIEFEANEHTVGFMFSTVFGVRCLWVVVACASG